MCDRASIRASVMGHTVLPYTAYWTDTWDALKTCDVDPSNSANVKLLYSDLSVDADQEYNSGDGWTREHLWPNSLTDADTDEDDAPSTDLHALRATMLSCNIMRSNNLFGTVSYVSADSDCNLKCDSANDVCEPRDEIKGQIARALFYMAVRYDATDDMEDGTTTNTWNDLELEDIVDGGDIDLLLQWNEDYPPDDVEIARNAAVTDYQGKSNPFIDDTSLANCLWGSSSSYCSCTSTADQPAPPPPPPPSPSPPPGVTADPVWVNELHYDNYGTDSGEFIEVAGVAGTDLSGWTIELYNGANGQTYGTIDLSGTLPDQQEGFGTLAFYHSGIQNGAPDGLALVDADGGLVKFLSYEGTLTATDGAASGETSVDIGLQQGDYTSAGASMGLSGSGSTYEAFSWSTFTTDSPGEVNDGQTFVATTSSSSDDDDDDDEDDDDDSSSDGKSTGSVSSPPPSPPPASKGTGSTSSPPPAAADDDEDEDEDEEEEDDDDDDSSAAASAGDPVWVNELHYDNYGTDSGEFIEVAGVAGTDLSGWTIELYNGASGQTYGTIDLSGTLPDQDSGYGTLAFYHSGIQNGAPDGFALVDASGSVVGPFLSYEGTLTATDGACAGQTSVDIGSSESSSTATGSSIGLLGSGASYDDFGWTTFSTESPGEVNDGQSFVAAASSPSPPPPPPSSDGKSTGSTASPPPSSSSSSSSSCADKSSEKKCKKIVKKEQCSGSKGKKCKASCGECAEDASPPPPPGCEDKKGDSWCAKKTKGTKAKKFCKSAKKAKKCELTCEEC